MVKKEFTLILLSLLCGVSMNVFGQEAEEQEPPVFFDASYTGDVFGNCVGGIKQGVTYMGFATIGFGINTGSIGKGRWKGGQFYVSGGCTHGGEASANLIGDLQVASNIEAGNHAFLQELWFKQNFNDKFDFTIGLQDLNADFATCDEAGLYINSTFGINAVFASNVSTPIFPITGLGFQAGWNITENIRWQACVFDGEVFAFDDEKHPNPYNVKYSLSQGALVATEFHYYLNERGIYKLGAYYHSAENQFGLYAIAEHRFDKFSVFGELAWAPKAKNDIYLNVIAGMNFYLFKERDDVFGIALTSALLSDESKKHETVIELTYKCQIIDQLFIQPNLQYIINPAGTEEKLNNALVAGLRFGFEF